MINKYDFNEIMTMYAGLCELLSAVASDSSYTSEERLEYVTSINAILDKLIVERDSVRIV